MVFAACILLWASGIRASAWEYRGVAYFLAFRDYDAARVQQDLADIRALGCNWVSLDVALTQDGATSDDPYLPYARSDQRHASLPYGHAPELWHHFPSDEEIGHFLNAAHGFGLSVLFKPHVHPRDSGMRVRLPNGRTADPMIPAAIHPSDPHAWFNNYARILLYYSDNFEWDGICVGNELSGPYAFSDEWRTLIERLRTVRDVPITCAFNWWVALHHQHRALVWLIRLFHLEDDLLGAALRRQRQAVEFAPGALRRFAVDLFAEYPDWCEALDSVGVNFYFPLSDGRNPSLRTLRRAWHRYTTDLGGLPVQFTYVDALRDWSRAVDKPLLFTEGGWGRWNHAARFPADWHVRRSGPNDALQARCYEAFFAEVAPLGVGMFFWDWSEPGFSPEGGPAEDVIRRRFYGKR